MQNQFKLLTPHSWSDSSSQKRSEERVLDSWTEEESHIHHNDPNQETKKHYLCFHRDEFSNAIYLFRLMSVELVYNDPQQRIQKLLGLRIYFHRVQDLRSSSFEKINHNLHHQRKLFRFVVFSIDRGRCSKIRRKQGFWRRWKIRTHLHREALENDTEDEELQKIWSIECKRMYIWLCINLHKK